MPAQYVEQGLWNGTVSIHLFICPSVCPAAAGLLLWTRQAGDIDCLLLQRQANAGSATLSAYVVAEHRLVSVEVISCVCVWVQCGISCHKKCLSSLQLKCGNPRNFLRSTASGDNEAPRSLLCTIAQCIGEINDRGLSVKVSQLMLTYYNMLNVASAIRFQWRMDFIAYPHKRRQSLKTEPRIKREIGYILCKVYMCGNGKS